MQDRKKHNKPLYPYGVCKLCNVQYIEGAFMPNKETTERNFFELDKLPILAREKTRKNR